MHRIGRTGRADKVGIAISFINEVEEEYQLGIEELMGKTIPMVVMPEEVEISDIFSEDDKPKEKIEQRYHQGPSINNSQGAFHEKSEKNKKINSGSAARHKDTFKKSGKRIKNKRSKRRR
jgi:ATP-dependent RNA helicase RhlE